MGINAVSNSTNTTNPSTTPATAGSDTLDQNAFLKLLVTQMTNQDPLNPQDESQMLSQIAQFSQVQTMNNVSTGQSQLQATGLLGKTVSASYIQNDTQQSVTGVVTGVQFGTNGVSLTVQGAAQPITLAQVTQVQN